MEKPPYLVGYLEKKGDKGLLKTWSVRWFQQDGANLYYYEDKHFSSTADAHGFIDLTSVVSVDALPPAQKKDRAKMISIGTNLGRTFLLREPNDDVRKAEEWMTRIDEWRKWIRDGGSSSPPLSSKHQEELSRSSNIAELKPMARGLSGAVERSRLMMKKSVQGMGTLVTTTVAKSKGGEDADADLDGVKKCGWLVKKGQRRWFALRGDELLWFKEAQTSANTVSRDNSAGSLSLKEGCVVRRVQERPSLVVISPSGKPYELVALDNGTRDVWLNYLTDACGGMRARAPTIQMRSSQKLKGWLKRKAGPGKLKPWKKIYAEQKEMALLLYPSDDLTTEVLGTVNLFDITNVDVTYEDGVSPTFEVRTSHTVWYFMALSEEDLEYWTSGLAQFWENKKARGGSKAKQPPPPSHKPNTVDDDVEVGQGEERVSDTLIVKTELAKEDRLRELVEESEDGGTFMGDESTMDEEQRRLKLLSALEHSSEDEDEGGKSALQVQDPTEPDEEFDSLMSALGTEKVKLRESSTTTKNSQSRSVADWDDDDDDDESMNEMLATGSMRAKQGRKQTTIKTGSDSVQVSASGKIVSPMVDRRTRSRTEIQRRLVAKQKELESGIVSEVSEKPQAKDKEPAKQPNVYDDDDDDDDDDQDLLDSVVLQSTGPTLQSAMEETDEFDALDAIPSFDFSDEEEKVPPKPKLQPKPKLKPRPKSKPSTGRKEVTAPRESNIFDDSSEEDAFSVVEPPKKVDTAPPKAVNYDFDDDNDDDDDDDDDELPVPPPPPADDSSESPIDSIILAPAAAAKPKAKTRRTKIVRRAKPHGPWVVGDRVMAQFRDDELWYKAAVVKLVGDDIVKVEFLGYGNVQACEEDEILPVPDEDLSEGDEMEVTVSEEEDAPGDETTMPAFEEDESEEVLPPPPAVDGDDEFSKELDSMLSLPPNPQDSESDDDLAPVPPPPEDFDDDTDDDNVDEQPAVPAADDWELDEEEFKDLAGELVSGSEEEEDAGGRQGQLSKAEQKKALAKSSKGPNYDKSGLFEAASKGSLKIVKAILAEGKVYVDYQKRKEPRGWSALHFAVQAGSEEVVKYLLEQGANVDLLDARDKSVVFKALGETAKVSIVERLLECNPNLMLTNDLGDTILHDARSYECVEVIFNHLAPEKRRQLLGEHGQDGFTALHRAASDPTLTNMCELFLQHDPDALDVEDMNGETPLMAAVRGEALQTMALLLEAGADVTAENQKGLTPFHVAIVERKELALELLMGGAVVSDKLLGQLIDQQLDEQLEEDEEEHDSDDSEELNQVRVNVVLKYLRMFLRSFTRKRFSPFRQVLSSLRLGEEYLKSSQFYHHSIMLLNAAQALCRKHSAGSTWELLAHAVRWQIGRAMKKARYARSDRKFAKLNMAVDDDFGDFQQRHYAFMGKLSMETIHGVEADALKDIEGCEEDGFSANVLDKLNALFEEEWE